MGCSRDNQPPWKAYGLSGQIDKEVRTRSPFPWPFHSPAPSVLIVQTMSNHYRYELVNFQETVLDGFPLRHSLSYGITDGGPAKGAYFYHRQRRCWNVIFSVVCVCHSVCPQGEGFPMLPHMDLFKLFHLVLYTHYLANHLSASGQLAFHWKAFLYQLCMV